jgi:hypothetical protein
MGIGCQTCYSYLIVAVIIKGGIVRKKVCICFILLFCFACLGGCAGIDAQSNLSMNTSIQGTRVIVFPFAEPYYKGRQLQGIGEPFSAVFVTKLAGVRARAELSRSGMFSSRNALDINKACKYAAENGYALMITGSVTEWIDGATQWSGTVDVAALTVSLYNPKTCELYGTLSARENGTWFTFVNSPTTRFYDTLSEAIVAKLTQ